jgi:MFS family permease
MSRPVKLLSISIALVCLLLALNFGLRSSMGFFMAPISNQFGYGREVFAFALALQNLWWGLSQPIAGAFADRFGTLKTIWIGAALYALGLYVTATADGVFGLNMGAGFLMGMGDRFRRCFACYGANGVSREALFCFGLRQCGRVCWAVIGDSGCSRLYFRLRVEHSADADGVMCLDDGVAV